jgi:hypothetical protein
MTTPPVKKAIHSNICHSGVFHLLLHLLSVSLKTNDSPSSRISMTKRNHSSGNSIFAVSKWRIAIIAKNVIISIVPIAIDALSCFLYILSLPDILVTFDNFVIFQ